MGASNSVPVVDLPNNVTEDPAAPFITSAADVAADLAAVANASLGLSAKKEPPMVSRQLSGAKEQDVLGVRINDYKMDDKVLGVGGFGKVRLATSRTTGHQVAVKIIKREKLQARSETLLAREVKHHERLRHENIVRLYTWIRTPTKYYLVMEVCPRGDLLGHLHQVGSLPLQTARSFFTQLMRGISFCHSLGIHHRDLKLENLLLADGPTPAEPIIKISDFGLSDLRPFNYSATYCGSPLYAAPELMDSASRAANPEGYDASRSDIWSCGVILWALLTSALPFDADDMHTLITMIVRGEPSNPLPSYVEEPARDLCSKLICVDPAQRPTAQDVLRHRFVTMENPQPAKGPPLPRGSQTMPDELPSIASVTTPRAPPRGAALPSTPEGGTTIAADAPDATAGAPVTGDRSRPAPLERPPKASPYKRGLSESTAFFRAIIERERCENAARAAESSTEVDAAEAADKRDGAAPLDVSEPDSKPTEAPQAGVGREKGSRFTAADLAEIKAIKEGKRSDKSA